MEKSERFNMSYDEDRVLKLFLEKICGQGEIWINGEPIMITVNCKITDDTIEEGVKEKIFQTKRGLYTESPVIQIHHLEAFKQALYEYIKAYTQSSVAWTKPCNADFWEEAALYAMTTIWTDATRQDFENPEAFLKRYTAFLTENQWEDLKEPQKIKQIGETQIWKKVMESIEERETPYQYCLYTTNADGKKHFLPSICYGIQGKTAYVYAIHQLYEKSSYEDEAIQSLRKTVKGRGVEPLGIVSLMSFLEEAKQRGIEKITMPDFFIMQYTTKNKMKENNLQWEENALYYRLRNKLQGISLPEGIEPEEMANRIMGLAQHRKKDGEHKVLGLEEEQEKMQALVEEARTTLKKEIGAKRKANTEQLNNIQRHSMNNRLSTLLLISRYYSTGIKFLEIPGDVSDNLVADITGFKIGREKKQTPDRRIKKEREEDER